MDDLIITVTVDSSMSYPGFKGMPPIEDVEAVGQQYVDAVRAGASICHHHGIHYMEKEMGADGKQLSQIDHDGWQRLTDKIRSVGTNPVIQYGIASARLPEKIELMKQGPDMMSYAFNVHDEFFQPDKAYPPVEMYALHPRDELETAAKAALQHGVKLEIECFYTGAFWNLEYIRRQGLLNNPIWATLFFGWQGGAWTPPTQKALLYMVDNLPAKTNWNVSVMDSKMQWPLLAMAIGMGGHVRVGWEDNPYMPNGDPARSCAELVEVAVKMAQLVGRRVATPDVARRIIFGEAAGGTASAIARPVG